MSKSKQNLVITTVKKEDNSLCFINNEQYDLGQISLMKKPAEKLDNNKHFTCVCVHNDTVYLGTKNSKLYIYKIDNQQDQNQDDFNLNTQRVITPHCQIVTLIIANDEYFITVPESDEDSLISIWQNKNLTLLTAFKGHKSQISKLAFLDDNRYLASCSWDCTIRIWSLKNLKNDQPVRVYPGDYPILVMKEFNSQIIVFGGDDCFLIFWNWKLEQIVKKQFGHAGSVTYIELFYHNILTAGGDNKFKIWEVKQNQSMPSLATIIKKQQDKKQHEVYDAKSKYSIKKIEQQRYQYDSNVFGSIMGDDLILMDRQGQMFLVLQDKTIHRLKNQFQYNQNVTSIGSYKDQLLVTSTKGSLKNFNLKQQLNAINGVQEQNVQNQVRFMRISRKDTQEN